MFFTTIPVGPLEANCYILGKDKKVTCIDPGGSPSEIDDVLKVNNVELISIINTHGHYDHVGANDYLAKKYNCPVYIHKNDIATLKDSTANLSAFFGDDINTDYEIKEFSDGEKIKTAGLEFQFIHTPVHTPVSVCFIQGDNLFSGDTLFKLSIGRTDLPGSNQDDMQKSLTKLKGLDNSLNVYPGHGEKSILAVELDNNPYLNG